MEIGEILYSLTLASVNIAKQIRTHISDKILFKIGTETEENKKTLQKKCSFWDKIWSY